MSNPPGSGHEPTPTADDAEKQDYEPDAVTEVIELPELGDQDEPTLPDADIYDAQFAAEAPTEVLNTQDLPPQPNLAPGFNPNDIEQMQTQPQEQAEAPSEPAPPPQPESEQPAERRFTAPGFDAGPTEQFHTVQEPDSPTEVISVPKKLVAVAPPSAAPVNQYAPEPPQEQRPKGRRGWKWALVILLVLAALAAVAIFGTMWLTTKSEPRISPQEQVRQTLQNFDTAVQKGDLATLRTITCGAMRDNYVNYDDKAWAETHSRVSAAKQYPVIASIDQVVVNGEHAEANVTTFMAYAPETRSTRSFDLQYTDGQWKVCQAPTA